MENNAIVTSFERYLLTERHVAKNTYDAYMRDLKQFFLFLDMRDTPCAVVKLQDLKEYLASLKSSGMSARSMGRKISCLKTLGNYLKERHELSIPTDQLIVPRIEKKLPEYLSEEQVMHLLSIADKEVSDVGMRNKVMLYVLYSTGMRISEMVNLETSAVHFDEGFITVAGKGNKERLVPLPDSVSSLLADYMQSTRLVLINRSNQKFSTILFPTFYDNALKPMSRQSFWMYVKDIALKAGITADLSPHHLRHSLATHLLKKGANLRSLQMLLGHEQLSTVQIYTHTNVDHLRAIYDKKHPRS